MAQYFFDLSSDGIFSRDKDGVELLDAGRHTIWRSAHLSMPPAMRSWKVQRASISRWKFVTELAVFSKSRPFSIPGFSASNDNAASVAASFT